ncbi:MAG TPA: hypothetical protein VF627_05940, partial [Abditibacterium sp.]
MQPLSRGAGLTPSSNRRHLVAVCCKALRRQLSHPASQPPLTFGANFATNSAMNAPAPPNRPDSFEKRWLMFLLRPADLLQLLSIVANPISQFSSGALPPDVRVADVFYDEGQNFLGMMLESDFFEPIQVHMRGQMMSAAWPRAVFSLSDDEETAPSDDEGWSEPLDDPSELETAPARPFIDEIQDAATRDFRLRALCFSAENLLQILRTSSARTLPEFPSYPPETHILGCVAQDQLGSWVLFVEHPDFEPCSLSQDDEMVYVEIPGDGEDRVFRIGLPGATL